MVMAVNPILGYHAITNLMYKLKSIAKKLNVLKR